MIGNDLEVLYELQEGGFSKHAIDFGRKLNSVMDEGEIEAKRMFKCDIKGKEFASSRGLERHQARQGMKHKNAKALSKKVSKLTVSERMLFSMSARFMLIRR